MDDTLSEWHDLWPNDFFPFVRNKMRGQGFTTPEEAVEGLENHVFEIPTSEWKIY